MKTGEKLLWMVVGFIFLSILGHYAMLIVQSRKQDKTKVVTIYDDGNWWPDWRWRPYRRYGARRGWRGGHRFRRRHR